MCSCLVMAPRAAAADLAIDAVVNAASRLAPGLPNSGIAQGSLFAVTGKGLGPDDRVDASFPLPAGEGLGGVAISIAAGGATLDAIMVSASATEVQAILPSATPLGAGTVTLTYNGATASAPITVVKSAFGIFTSANGQGPALAYNLADGGDALSNGFTQSAQTGQNMAIVGTGLGPIAGDERQSGAADVPDASVKVWVGSREATVVSAGRGSCCATPDNPAPVRPAAWDVIVFSIPAGVTGCQVSIAVETSGGVSNFGTVSVADGGGTCPEITALGTDFTTLSGNIVAGAISFTRLSTKTTTSGISADILSDAGGAAFQRVDLGSNPVPVAMNALSQAIGLGAGSCTLTLSRTTPTGNTGTPGTPILYLDAGPAINVRNSRGSKPMNRGKDNTYGGSFASITSINVPGVGPINTGGQPFLEAGTITIENGGGGADIGPFTADFENPKPVVWDNMDQVNSVDRANGVTVTWSGGDPAGLVRITGTASARSGDSTTTGLFICTERVSAGQFTVPSFITRSMPAVTDAVSSSGQGLLLLTTLTGKTTTLPGVDLFNFISTTSTGKTVTYP